MIGNFGLYMAGVCTVPVILWLAFIWYVKGRL